MSDYSDIREGLATQLRTADGGKFRADAEWPDAINPPCAIVMPPQDGDAIDYERTFGNDAIYRFEILILVPNGTIRSAHRALDEYLTKGGTKSLVDAINEDGTLDGVADFTLVRGARDYGDKVGDGFSFPGALLVVDVYKS